MSSAIQTIANKCGVSISTVSRVFNQRGNVAEATRKNILEIARSLEYQPKYQARQDVIALLVGRTDAVEFNLYEAALLRHVTQTCLEAGLPLRIFPVTDLDTLSTSFVRVAVNLSPSLAVNRLRQYVGDSLVVNVNSRMENCYAVCADHFAGVTLAVNHLVEKGHRRIGFFQSKGEAWGSQERLRGYRETMALQQLESLVGSYTFDHVDPMFGALVRLLKQNLSAIIISGEDIALPALHIIQNLGLNIPRDLSVITYETPRISPFLSPGPTTISQNLEQIGKDVASLVANLFHASKAEPERQIWVANSLIERESVKTV